MPLPQASAPQLNFLEMNHAELSCEPPAAKRAKVDKSYSEISLEDAETSLVEVQSLRDENVKLLQQVEDAKRSLSDINDAHRLLESQWTSAKEELDDTQRHGSKMRQENERLCSEVEEHSNRAKELMQRADEAATAIRLRDDSLANLQAEIVKIREENVNLRQQRDELLASTQRIEILESEKLRLERIIEGHEDELIAVCIDAAKQADPNAPWLKLVKKRRSELTEENDKLRKTVEEERDKANDYRKNYRDAKGKIEELQRSLLEQRIRSEEAAKNAANSSSMAAAESTWRMEKSRLQEDVKEEKRKKIELEYRVRELEDRNHNLRREGDRARREADEAMHNLRQNTMQQQQLNTALALAYASQPLAPAPLALPPPAATPPLAGPIYPVRSAYHEPPPRGRPPVRNRPSASFEALPDDAPPTGNR